MFEREDGFESPLRKQSGGLFLGRGSGVLTHKKQQVRAMDFPTKAPILSHQISALIKNE